jgi:hypothetical protein
MIPRTKYFIILVVLISIVIGSCKSKPTPTAPVGGSSSDSSSSAEDSSGSALLIYDYSIKQPGAMEILVHVDIPVTIKRDGENPGKYIVTGSKDTTAYFVVYGKGGPKGGCTMNCDFPVAYPVKGNLKMIYEDEGINCQISTQFIGDFKLDQVKRYGDCPAAVTDVFDCPKLIMALADQHTYVFDKNNLVDIPKSDAGVLRQAEIKNVVLPIGLDDACKWGE